MTNVRAFMTRKPLVHNLGSRYNGPSRLSLTVGKGEERGLGEEGGGCRGRKPGAAGEGEERLGTHQGPKAERWSVMEQLPGRCRVSRTKEGWPRGQQGAPAPHLPAQIEPLVPSEHVPLSSCLRGARSPGSLLGHFLMASTGTLDTSEMVHVCWAF